MELNWIACGASFVATVIGFALGVHFGYSRGRRDEARRRVHELDPIYRAYRSLEADPILDHLQRLERGVEELKESREALEAARTVPSTYRSY